MCNFSPKQNWIFCPKVPHHTSIIAQNNTAATRDSTFEIPEHYYSTSQTIAELLYNPPMIFTPQEAIDLAHFLCEN